ncbi:hypothetical protein [Caldicellulosiruptor acetigenus]|nr:hypothetical protein [Caldicellulosiruptor acetigenus]WAM36913.1 hypothetical protein OTK01_000716 [Caldicellulosiruptor acetigenus]
MKELHRIREQIYKETKNMTHGTLKLSDGYVREKIATACKGEGG